MYYCYDKKRANANLHGLAMQLITNKRLIRDFWHLFPGRNTKADNDEIQKKSIGEFITTNGVKVKSMTIGESPRGETFMYKNKVYRPDLAILDDIDVDKSTRNTRIIEQNYNWLKGELFGWLTYEKGTKPKIVVLWNTIREDGLCPRIEMDFRNAPDWNVFILPVYREDGSIVWGFTEDTLQEKRDELWTISFNQNFLLIPYGEGEKIVTRDMIKYDKRTKFEKYRIGVDPAISIKNNTDPFGIVVTGYDGEKKHIVEVVNLKGEMKKPQKSLEVIKQLYKKYDNSRVVCETIAFQQIYSKLLQNAGVATDEVTPTKDKVTRLMEWQAEFENGNIYFHPDTQELVDQLVNFPDGEHDDLVDAMVHSFVRGKGAPILVFG